jgi:hypothetical protein
MPSHRDGTSSRVPARPNAFSPEFLEQVLGVPEPLTASEADFSGPWKVEEVGGPPARFAVLRDWESAERGDVPEAAFADRETARIFAAVLCLVEREPLFHLEKEAEPGAPVPGGYPVTAVYGDQGARVCGWLRRFNPRAIEALHLAEALVRTPRSLAEVAGAAGGGALAQVGRLLAEPQED